MKIVALQIAGFKSFADPVVLEFREGLTGIVGPNGCGKSNIVDALRWVMGESSARGLRGGEMEDVLFAGSDWRPAADVAEVVLWIEGPVAGHVDAGERLRVARRLERGGGSRFTLDGREVRARDVQLLFADSASGSRSPAIVGQGQIVELVEWRPEDRRRLLEDAAGVSGLLGRRREALSRIAHTADNLARLKDRIALLAERKTRLAREAQRAERFRRLQERKRFLERTGWLVAYARVRSLHRRLGGELGELGEQLARLTRRATRLDAVLRAREGRCRELGERSRDLERERARLEERERAARAAQALRLREQARREAQRAELGRAEQEARRRLDEIAREDQSLRRRLEELRDRCDRLDAEQRQDREQGPKLESRLREAREELERQLGRERDAEGMRERLRARLETVSARERGLARAAAAEERDLSRRIATLRAELAALERAREELAEAEREGEARRRAVAAQLDELRATLDAVRSEERRLREQLFARRLARKEGDLELRQLGERARALERECEELAREEERLRREERRLAEVAASLRGGREAEQEERLRAARDRVAARIAVMRRRVTALQRLLVRTREREHGCERRIAGLESEIRTREEWAATVPEHALVHRIDIEEEVASALAALLGEELLAGLEPCGDAPFWRRLGEDEEEPPAWPEGVEPLAPRIGTAPELGRLLKRVGLTSAERASRLQAKLRAGEALVSPDGGLWRWDGFVRPPGCADHLSRCLGHERRLAELRAERVAAEAERARLARARTLRERTLARAEERITALVAEDDRIKRELADWERRREERARRLGTVEEELARVAARRREAERLRAVRNTELKRLQTRLGALTERLGQLATEQLEAEHAACSKRIQELEARVTATAQDLADRAEEQRARIDALRRKEERCAVLRGELAALAQRQEELERLKARVRAEREALEAERQELSRRLEEVEREAAALQALRERAQARVREAERALREWEERCRRRARAREEAAEETERLHRHLERIAAERRRGEAWCRELARRLSELDEEEAAADVEEDADQWAAMRVGVEERLQALGRTLARERERCLLLRRRMERTRERLGGLAERRAALEARMGEVEMERCRTEELLRRRLGGLPRDDEQGRLELDELLASWPEERIEAERERVERLLARLGTVNLLAVRELDEVGRELDDLEAQRSELAAALARLERAAGRLEREARERLLAVFREVDGRFRDLFQRLFGGGEARLSWVGEDDPLKAGLELLVRPPGKRLQRLSLLSGGEKSLAALALLFAFQEAHPPPLCVFDEVDAALDDANVARFVGLMEELARERGLRFLVVTHHPHTMGHMDRLFGVTMGERGVSRVLSLALGEALELRATA